MNKQQSFMQMCVDGEELVSNLDLYVEKWHKSKSKKSLREYLGMTILEYNNWLLNETVVEKFINNRKKESDIEKGRIQGIAWCMAFLYHYHGEESFTTFIARETGIKSIQQLKDAEVDQIDIDNLRSFFKDE